eukprot:scaffold543_cov119-Cylindrotheca_fusiformis.AAC.19
MGQTPSSLNPEQYPSIALSSEGILSDYKKTKPFPFDQVPPDFNDDLLWQEFGNSVDDQLPILNRHTLTLSILWAAVEIPLTVGFFIVIARWEKLYVAAILALTSLLVFGVVLVGLKSIIRRNEEADEVIAKICSDFESRFKTHGYVPEYRTKYTGVSMTETSNALRLLVFKPVADVEA